MAGRDLRALFSTNDRQLEAGEAFTDRHGQWEFVQSALSEHLAHVTAPGFDVEDLEAPRTNLLVFHGVGGIGKTTLSRTLEAALADSAGRPARWGEPTWPDRPALLPVRIDLARSAGTDFERVLLTIRLALAAHLGQPLPAFDIALRRYWEHQHPGESLEEYLARGGLAGRFGKSLPQQVQAALSDVAQALMLPGSIGSAVGQLTGALTQALRERRQTVRALAGCARLADLLEAEPDVDALSYYPHLLAWELAQLPADKQVVPVILLDTFEDVGTRTHRDLERLLQRLVWLMPNAFFIITGRGRLQWADPALAGQLDFTGPAAWPGLAQQAVPTPRTAGTTTSGRQALIGDFSADDCDDYLARRLVKDGQPLIGPELRATITARSHGLPLYLDLSVLRFLELRRAGHTPTPADFDADFPALITRTVADLTPDERHILRSVSLFDAFDLDLATHAAGLPHQAAAARLIERPFVRHDPFALWPYNLHALIRSTLRTADDATDDRWTDADWRAASTRALAALGDQWRAAAGPDRRLLVGCLRQGLAIARDHRLDLDWLTDAAHAYTDDYVWEPLPLPEAAEGPATAADALAELLSALARRQHEHRSHTVERLTTALDTNLLPAELAEMARYFQAKAHRDLGNTSASRDGMQQVATGGGRYAPDAARGLAHLARAAGDFPTALTTAQTLGWPGRGQRVLGDIHFAHGDMTAAATAYTAARTEAEQHGNKGEQAIAQAHLALTTAFTDPTRAESEIAHAEQLLAGLDQRATTLTAQVAELVRTAGRDDDEFTDRTNQLQAEIAAGGLTSVALLLDLAVAFHHAVRDHEADVHETLRRLAERTAGGDYTYYLDIAHHMAGLTLPTPTTVRWAGDTDAVPARWRTLVTARR
ncbi:ATP/GTP-binding protein [Streptomyces sp. LHD-70]|uniref:ATP/GTP-binding protein n=1 Tax=Streptomyces sp. LHD-70 TaxID=3072140 RepID=UPI00280F68AE|nr:ATP/GTP-binding protein [Streptomyces sp. LHD-70]MDQ8707576.1 ATP/GTP-binding protein [Streptomyces sp. LHD-70]